METLTRLGSLLSPSFFAILAGFSLMAAALLYLVGRWHAADAEGEGMRLSHVEPTEHRVSGYLLLAFGWSMCGLVFSFISGATGVRDFWSLAFAILLLLFLLFTLCFMYAAAGTLLCAVRGEQEDAFRGWFFPRSRYVDTVIVRFGDALLGGLFKESWHPAIVTGVVGWFRVPDRSGGSVASGKGKSTLAEDLERLERRLHQYEASLSPEQREKVAVLRGIAAELRDM
ncbi:MAG: hypothetical protein KAU10_09405 [Dehalococcoidia bacterium]|nr:hypothetical protein [Dehalococcoidia bacterium]